MKKIIICLLFVFFLTGCTNNHATDPVKDYLNKYLNHDKEVLGALEELFRQENLEDEQQKLYDIIMKKQYTDLEYSIEEETYNGNKAIIKVLITVYDYQKSKQKALKEKNENVSMYTLPDGSLDFYKYMNLQLKYMKEEKSRVHYTVLFNVFLEDDEWFLETPDYKVIEKLHGLYNYLEED